MNPDYVPLIPDSALLEVQAMSTQIQRLADVIMFEIPGEPSRGDEGAIDCAIRLLRKAYVHPSAGVPS